MSGETVPLKCLSDIHNRWAQAIFSGSLLSLFQYLRASLLLVLFLNFYTCWSNVAIYSVVYRYSQQTLMMHNGTLQNGTILNGLLQNGTILNGSFQNGSILNGSLQNGTILNGSFQNGSIQNSSFQNGMLQMVHYKMVHCYKQFSYKMVHIINGTCYKKVQYKTVHLTQTSRYVTKRWTDNMVRY